MLDIGQQLGPFSQPSVLPGHFRLISVGIHASLESVPGGFVPGPGHLLDFLSHLVHGPPPSNDASVTR